MINEQTLTELEGWLGYPLRDPAILMRTEGSDTAESRAAANVDLRAEFYRREHAYSFEEARPVRKQIICRHFAGLYVVNAVGPEEVVKGRRGTPVAVSGLELVELNPSSPAGVYYHGPASGLAPWSLFDSLADSKDFDRRVFKLSSDAPDFEEELSSPADRYPRACARMKGAFQRKFGAVPPVDEKADFSNARNVSLFTAYEAFGPVADALIERAEGRKGKLSPSQAKQQRRWHETRAIPRSSCSSS